MRRNQSHILRNFHFAFPLHADLSTSCMWSSRSTWSARTSSSTPYWPTTAPVPAPAHWSPCCSTHPADSTYTHGCPAGRTCKKFSIRRASSARLDASRHRRSRWPGHRRLIAHSDVFPQALMYIFSIYIFFCVPANLVYPRFGGLSA